MSHHSTETAMAPSALRLNPVRARRLCRDTKGQRRVRAGERAGHPRPAGARAPRPGRGEGARPVVRRSHVGPGACASHRAPARARNPSASSMEPSSVFSCEYSIFYTSLITICKKNLYNSVFHVKDFNALNAAKIT